MDYFPHKEGPYLTLLTVGVNLIICHRDIGIPTSGMLIYKFLFNTVLSTPYAKIMLIDRNKFYLNTPMSRYKYMTLLINIMPQEIIN